MHQAQSSRPGKQSPLALSRQRSVTVAGSQQQTENAGSLLELEPARSSARACLPFRETVSAASGAAARASSDPRPGHRALRSRATSSSRGFRDHAPAGRAGLGPGRPRSSARRTRPPREGRGGPAPAVRSVRAESPAALGAPAGGSRDPARVHVDRVKCPTLP